MKPGLLFLIALLLAADATVAVAGQTGAAEQPASGAAGEAPNVPPRPRRVLALYSDSSDQPVMISFAQTFQDVLKRQSGNTVEHYPEFFDSPRFPGESQKRAMVDYLRHKYADRTIDVLFAWGPFTLPLVLEHRAELFPETPIVYYSGTLDEVKGYPLPPMTGVLNPDTYEGTLEVALRLHPDTTQAFIISGTPAGDKSIEQDVARQLQEFEGRVKLTYLTDLPLDRLMATVKSLPRRSIIIYSRQQSQGESGRVLQQADYLDLVSRTAPVPVYGPWLSLLGYGSVGGIVDDRAAGATKAAEIVLRVLGGTRPQDIPPDRTPRVPTFDSRQLVRWGIDEDRLPPGSVVLFREPTIWSEYRSYIIGTAVVLGVQTMLIGGLLVQRVRRRRVENALRESEQRFRLMADKAPVMIWRSNVDNANDFFNLPWLELRGRSLEEESGSGWTQGVHPDDLERCLALRATSFDERQSFRLEYRLQRGDGKYRWVLDTGVPRFAPDGAFAGYIGSCVDITERREAEQALQESEKRQKRELEAQVAERTQAVSALVAVSQSVTSALDLGPLLARILDEVKRVLPHTSSIIALREGDELVNKASLGPQFPVSGFAPLNRAVLSAQPFVVRDVAEDVALGGAARDTIGGPAQFRAMIGAPLTARGRVVGVLALGHEQAAAFTSDDLVTLQAFANQVAIAIENARLYAESRRTATLDERARVARELHDSVTQSLHSIGLYADAADRAVGLGKMEVGVAHVHEVHQLAREAMHEMRELIFEMRPAVLDERGLGPALKARLEGVEARTGVAVSFETSGAPAARLPIETELELYRIAQEALTNVVKHARAMHVWVRLTYGDRETTVADAGGQDEPDGRVVLDIRDDGIGFDLHDAREGGTFGLRSISERAARIGAVVTIDTAPGQGAAVRIDVARHGS